MSTGSNRDWEDWGVRDPFYGVATFGDNRGKGESNEWTPDELYASGAADWKLMKRRLDAYGYSNGTVVEIGSGVGRYSRAMAADFDSVTGLDVSAGMIEQAQQHAGLPNISYQLSDGQSLPFGDQSADVIFSAFVFQHFDSTEYASEYFREMARVLKPGGTMMVHLPLHQYPVFSLRLRPIFRAQYALVKAVGQWRAERDRKKHSGNDRPLKFRLISYELAEVLHELEGLGFHQFEVEMFTLPSYPEEWLSVLFATRK